jgi:hypothetical protein
MRNTTIFGLAVLLTAIVGGWLLLSNRGPSIDTGPRTQPRMSSPSSTPNASYQRRPPRVHPNAAAEANPAEPEATGQDESLAARVGLTPDQIESYLQKRQRSPDSLITVFRATGDKTYLVEAAQQYPGDPRVQWGVLTENLYPEQQRQWIERFKQGAPENSLANYVSALDNYRQGDAPAAFKDLVAAEQKPAFKDYTMDQIRGLEDLMTTSGKSERLAKESTMQAVPMNEFSTVKQLAQEMASQQEKYRESGDATSSDTMAHLGIELANRYVTGEGSRFLIGQLVGMAIETRFLQDLQPDKVYDFLGQTPAQRLELIAVRKKDLRTLTEDASKRLPQLSDAEAIQYFNRLQGGGEVEAVTWLREH